MIRPTSRPTPIKVRICILHWADRLPELCMTRLLDTRTAWHQIVSLFYKKFEKSGYMRLSSLV